MMNERLERLQHVHERVTNAEELRGSGQLDKAAAILVPLSEKQPDCWGVVYTLALVRYDQRDFPTACSLLVKADFLNPDDALTLAMLGRTCLALRDMWRAERYISAAVTLDPQDVAVRLAVAARLQAEGQYDLAVEAFRAILAICPNDLDMAIGLGSCLRASGHAAEAAALLDPLVSRNRLVVLQELARLPYGISTVDLLAEAAKFPRPDDPSRHEVEMALAFVCAEVLHKAGRTTEACAAIRDANVRVLAGTGFDPARHRKGTRTAEVDLATDLARLPVAEPDPAVPISLFVLGTSRSGKTTLEGLLTSHPSVYAGGENHYLSAAVSTSLQAAGFLPETNLACLPIQLQDEFRRRYWLAWRRRAGAAKVFVTTAPGFIHQAARLAAILPNVRFALIGRNADDVRFRMLLKRYANGYLYASDAVAARDHIDSYARLADLLAEARPGMVHRISYEAMIADPEAVRAGLLGFLGLSDAGLAPSPQLPDDRGAAAPYASLLAGG